METNLLQRQIRDLRSRSDRLCELLGYGQARERLGVVEGEMADPNLWNDQAAAQALGRERARLEALVTGLDGLRTELGDCAELLAMAEDEGDEGALAELQAEADRLQKRVEDMEFRRMFSGEFDSANAWLDIQAGSGGTEAQDWAEMLLRMYLRFAENCGFDASLAELSGGEVAGIKSATINIQGDHAFGWLRTETGVHRLVRKSPFDSGGRRHTSFASVFVSPEVDERIDIEINPADVRVDTYRASGKGGQHVNKTDSAVRLTHLPTAIAVQCQSERSQHANRERAWNMLRARLYEMAEQERRAQQQEREASKDDIGWGSQIRSYVLDDARIKDLRTGVENRNTQAVLDGELMPFIRAALQAGSDDRR